MGGRILLAALALGGALVVGCSDNDYDGSRSDLEYRGERVGYYGHPDGYYDRNGVFHRAEFDDDALPAGARIDPDDRNRDLDTDPDKRWGGDAQQNLDRARDWDRNQFDNRDRNGD